VPGEVAVVKVSIIIAVYNEAGTVGTLLERCLTAAGARLALERA
jgi:hypothetical protein